MQEGQVKRVIFSPKIIGLVLVVIIIIVGVVAYNKYKADVARRPETYGTHFMTLLTQKDGSSTYNMFNSYAKKQSTSDEWNQWVVFAFNNYKGGTPKLIKKDIVPDPGHLYSKNNDQVVRLRYEVNTNGHTGEVDLILTQDGNSWKVAQAGLVK